MDQKSFTFLSKRELLCHFKQGFRLKTFIREEHSFKFKRIVHKKIFYLRGQGRRGECSFESLGKWKKRLHKVTEEDKYTFHKIKTVTCTKRKKV